MIRNKPIVLFLLFSLALHLAVLTSIHVYIEGEESPILYAWPEIIDGNTLLAAKKDYLLPEEYFLDTGRLTRRLFLVSGYLGESKLQDSVNLPLFEADFKEDAPGRGFISPAKSYIYLWERTKMFYPFKEETVSYKVLVSPQGKVIFSYPEKLPFNSQENLYFQAYVREAALFFSDRFFWTKLEGVVK